MDQYCMCMYDIMHRQMGIEEAGAHVCPQPWTTNCCCYDRCVDVPVTGIFVALVMLCLTLILQGVSSATFAHELHVTKPHAMQKTCVLKMLVLHISHVSEEPVNKDYIIYQCKF